MNSLHGPRLKLRRADEHLDTIKALTNKFIARKPYTFVIEANPTPPNYIIVAKKERNLPDKELSVLIGDFAHNARCILDYIIYQLNTLPIDDRRRRYICFPICDKQEWYENSIKSNLAGVAPEYTTIVERFQPYHGAKGFENDALSILREINDTDKHRAIHVVGTFTEFTDLSFSGPGPVGTNYIAGRGPAMVIGQDCSVNFGGVEIITGSGVIDKDRTIVANLTSIAPLQVNMHINAKISINFGVGNPRVEGRHVMDTLTLIYNRVKEVIGGFEQALPK